MISQLRFLVGLAEPVASELSGFQDSSHRCLFIRSRVVWVSSEAGLSAWLHTLCALLSQLKLRACPFLFQ